MNVLHPSWATTDLGSQTASSRLQCRQRQSPTTQSSVQNIYNNDNVIGRWWSANEMQIVCWQLHANQQKVYKLQALTLLLLLAVCCVHQEGYKKIQHSEWDSSSVYILGNKLKKARKNVAWLYWEQQEQEISKLFTLCFEEKQTVLSKRQAGWPWNF